MDSASSDYSWSPAGGSERGARGGLPNNPEAEEKVLAAMLLSPEVVEGALVELVSDDFYRPANKTLFSAMQEMYSRTLPIDAVSLIDFLKSMEKLCLLYTSRCV